MWRLLGHSFHKGYDVATLRVTSSILLPFFFFSALELSAEPQSNRVEEIYMLRSDRRSSIDEAWLLPCRKKSLKDG